MKKLLKFIVPLSLTLFFAACDNEELLEQTTQQLESVSSIESSKHLILPNGMHVVKEGDYYIFQGDIYFTEKDIEEMSAMSRGGYDTSSLKWGYTINYYYNNNDFTDPTIIDEAITHWNEATNLNFVRIYNQSGTYIKFQRVSTRNSTDAYGKPSSGPRIVKLTNTATVGNVMHEIGHALGLVHEQCRPDRDNYITINLDNIPSDLQYQYQIWDNTYCSQFSVPFDYYSIMMYPSYSDEAIDPTVPVMTINGGDQTSYFGGHRSRLSEEDCLLFSHLYPIEKVTINGPSVVSYPSTVQYSINAPSGSNVYWELSTRNDTIISDQGNNSVLLKFSNTGQNVVLKATVYTPHGYRLVRQKIINKASYPVVTDILMYKYCQGDGEYTLEACVTNPDNATLTWSTDGTLYDILYPDDANFNQYPNLFKAVDFYSSGMHTVSVTASNSVDNTTFSKAFYIDDCKSMFMSLAPNPSTNGLITVSIGKDAGMARESLNLNSAIFNIYGKGKKIYSTKLSSKENVVNLSSLAEGEYVAELIDESNKLVLHQALYIGEKYKNKK